MSDAYDTDALLAEALDAFGEKMQAVVGAIRAEVRPNLIENVLHIIRRKRSNCHDATAIAAIDGLIAEIEQLKGPGESVTSR